VSQEKRKQRSAGVFTVRAQSEETSPDKSSVMSWWKRDLFFRRILVVVTIGWNGGFIWDDNNM